MICTLTFDNGTKTGITQDGVKIPNPSSYSVTMNDIDLNSNRATNGDLSRTVKARNKYSVACTWDWLNDEQLDKLLAACKTTTTNPSDLSITLKFRNPLHKLDPNASSGNEDGYTTTRMYVEASRTASLVATSDEGKDYWSLSLTFIQY